MNEDEQRKSPDITILVVDDTKENLTVIGHLL